MSNLIWKPIQIKLGQIKPWSDNPRMSTKAQAERLIQSERELGQVQTIAIGPAEEDNKFPLYDGHQRYSAWLTVKGAEFEMTALQSNRSLTEDERRKMAVLLHTATGGWNWDKLAGWRVGELKEWGLVNQESVKGWNTDMLNVKEILKAENAETVDAEPQIDRAAELLEKWKCERGQTWRLGEFGYLYCGDASTAKIKCDFAIYDPPYEWEARQQENTLSWVDWKNCLLMGLKNSMPLVQRSDYNHWWIWDTGMARFGGKGYKPMSGCAIMINFGDKRRWNDNAVSVLGKYNIECYQYPVQVVHIQDHLGGMDRERDEKPQVLCKYIIDLYSNAGEVIGDPFAGCGSFLVASIAMKRQYHGSEISPENCAVILEKFYKLTSILPVNGVE